VPLSRKRTSSQVFVLLWRRWQVPLYVACFLFSLNAASAVVAVPWLARNQLGASESSVGVTGGLGVGIYMLGCLILSRYGNRLAPKRFVMLSQVIFCILWAAMGFVPSLWMLFALLILAGMAGSLFSGPMMGWVSAGNEGKWLNKRLGIFNLCWSVGAILGFFLGGRLYDIEYWLAFVLAACSSVCVVFIVATAKAPQYDRQPAGRRDGRPIENPDLPAYRGMCKIALFASAIGSGAVGAPLAILLGSMSLTAGVHGTISSTYAVAMAFVFFLLAGTTRWQYKRGFLWVCQVFAAAMVLSVGFCHAGWQIVACVGALGLVAAVMYKSNQFYSASGGREKSASMALHEATAASGVVLGSIGGGFLAEQIGIRSVYPVAAGCMILAVLAEAVAYSRYRIGRPSQE